MLDMYRAVVLLYTVYTGFGAYTACNTRYQLTLMDVVEAGTTLQMPLFSVLMVSNSSTMGKAVHTFMVHISHVLLPQLETCLVDNT